MSLLASGCVSATSHSSLRAFGPEGWAKLLIKIRASLLSFSSLYGLFASILDSVSGNPQLPGTSTTRDMGEVHRDWHGC